ncbi:MAG TPA: SGNH/GDSL hydrolase family protein, partial [Candidatus Omnitrophota bacterium]|nr:SGNH/GDSL hydrolase family protein [Candidatus Omnitrophota bacterium]
CLVLRRWPSMSAAAVFTFNTFAILILLNLLIGAGFWAREALQQFRRSVLSKHMLQAQKFFDPAGKPLDNGRRSEYQLDWFDYTAYENAADQRYASAVLDDFFELAERGFIYQPWVQFAEPFFDGELLHIDADPKGFPVRRTINPPAQDDLAVIRVFCLGGSTTFGYNVSDEHTWPSFLSRTLNERAKQAGLAVSIEVTNYGHGHYTPSQELALLTALIRSGHRPDLVIFMDGVNWGTGADEPYFTVQLIEKFFSLQFDSYDTIPVMKRLNWVPMIRLANGIKKKILKGHPASAPRSSRGEEEDSKQDYVEVSAKRFEMNQRMSRRVCDEFGVKSLFFLQPDAMYNYSKDLYRRDLPEIFLRRRDFRNRFHKDFKPAGYLDITHLFNVWGPQRKAIVDNVHYSPPFNEFLAGYIADHFIDLESLAKDARQLR